MTSPERPGGRVYDGLGEELTEDVESTMRAWLEEDCRRQSTRPSSAPTTYGWMRDGVAPCSRSIWRAIRGQMRLDEGPEGGLPAPL